MRRRDLIAGIGSAAALSLAARSFEAIAQQRVPVIGVLGAAVLGTVVLTPEFAQALKQEGFIEGQNVTFKKLDSLPGLTADLVRERVDVIVCGGLLGPIAAKAATTTIPIVFWRGEDPVKDGIVASLNRPGGNATGFTNFANQLLAKQLELLHTAVPQATVIGFLVNPNNPNANPDTKDAQAAAPALGLTLRVLTAASERDFEQVFATVSQERIGAMLVGVEPFFWARREELAALAARHAVPVLYERSLFPAAGGLMSYGTDYREGFRQVGTYVGRILKGAKPADLPVVQPTKFEFVINLKTAKALGLTIPETLLATADEVIQ
jgi:putative ABC transport system substrate-binding protein